MTTDDRIYTAALDAAAKVAYDAQRRDYAERVRLSATTAGGHGHLPGPDWDDLNENAKIQLKAAVAPLVSAVLGPVVGVTYRRAPADPELGHTFRISVVSRGSYGIGVGGQHSDADAFDGVPWAVEVRGWSLSEALERAARLPLWAWAEPAGDRPDPDVERHST